METSEPDLVHWQWTTEAHPQDVRWIDTGTVGAEITVSLNSSMTGTVTRVTTQELGYRRSRARADLEDAGNDHKDGHLREWASRTTRRARLSVAQILEELAALGFAWRDIARVMGVTVQAIQKWRRGTGASASNRFKAASFLAGCNLIAESYEVQEIASWFEMPLVAGIPVTPLDLWSAERPDLVFDYASGHAEADETLSLWQPDWQTKYRSDFEVFTASDAQLSIRLKER